MPSVPPQSHFPLSTSQLDPAQAVQVITEQAARLHSPVADLFGPGAEVGGFAASCLA